VKILALDTTSKLASVSLLIDGNLVGTKYNDNQKTHSERVIPMMEELLKENGITPRDIDLFGVTIGPGSFTGIRIGVATIKGMAQALGKQVVGVTTLEAMAYIESDSFVCSMIDARHDNVYIGLYDENKNKVFEDCLNIDEAIEKLQGKKVDFVGDGAIIHSTRLSEVFDGRIEEAKDISERLAYITNEKNENAQNPHEIKPIYLRKAEPERKGEKI